MTQRRITINNSRSLRHYPCHQNKHNSHSFIVWYYQLQHQQHDFRLRVNRRNQKDNKKKTLETHGIFQLHSSNCPISDWNRIYCTSPFVRQTQSTSTCCWVSFYQTNSCLSTHREWYSTLRVHTHTHVVVACCPSIAYTRSLALFYFYYSALSTMKFKIRHMIELISEYSHQLLVI